MSHRSIRLSAVVAALAVVLAAGACGDSGDGDRATAGARGAGSVGSDEREIRATLRYLYVKYNAGDAAAFCSRLSERGEREVAAFGRAFGRGSGCTAALGGWLDRENRSGQNPLRIDSVSIDGDTATVMARGGLAGRSGNPVRMVVEDGDWKVANPLSVGRGGP